MGMTFVALTSLFLKTSGNREAAFTSSSSLCARRKRFFFYTDDGRDKSESARKKA